MSKNPHQKKKLDEEFLTLYVERKKIAGKEWSADFKSVVQPHSIWLIWIHLGMTFCDVKNLFFKM